MAQKIRILALAALVSVMICPAQAADPSTPAQVTDDPASSESSIGESIGGFFKQLGNGIEKTIKDIKIDPPGANKGKKVVAQGWILNNSYVCYEGNPKPVLVGNRGGGTTIDPGNIALANTCDTLIKNGQLRRVDLAGSGSGARLSSSAGGEQEGDRCTGDPVLILDGHNGNNATWCYWHGTNTIIGIVTYPKDKDGKAQYVFTRGRIVKGKFIPDTKKNLGAAQINLPALNEQIRNDPALGGQAFDSQAFDNLRDYAARENARIMRESAANDARVQAELDKRATAQYKAGQQSLNAELEKQLKEIQRTGQKNLRDAGVPQPK